MEPIGRPIPYPDKQTLRSVASDGQGKIFGGGYGEFGYWEADDNGQLQYSSLRGPTQTQGCGIRRDLEHCRR